MIIEELRIPLGDGYKFDCQNKTLLTQVAGEISTLVGHHLAQGAFVI